MIKCFVVIKKFAVMKGMVTVTVMITEILKSGNGNGQRSRSNGNTDAFVLDENTSSIQKSGCFINCVGETTLAAVNIGHYAKYWKNLSARTKRSSLFPLTTGPIHLNHQKSL